MKKLLFILMIGAMLLALPFSAYSAADEIQKIYEAAKEEGEVAYWTESDPDEVKIVIQKFEEKFPGIKVKHFEINAPQMTERVILESKAKRTSWDVFEMSVVYALPLYDRKMIEKVDWINMFGLPSSALALDDFGVVTHHLAFAIIYNTDLVTQDQAPKTWEDLLDPKWKGKIVIEVRAQIFSALAMAWGEEKVDSYVQKLKAQNPLLIKGGTTVLQTVGAGERPIGIGTYISKVPFWRKKGVPTEWAKLGPVCADTYLVFVPNNPMHPNAAKLFTSFYGTQEGQKALEEACYKSSILPDSGTNLGNIIKSEDLKVVIIDNAEKAKYNMKLRMKYSKMFGAIK
jgi:iron(III) transport system substrate-binding protein